MLSVLPSVDKVKLPCQVMVSTCFKFVISLSLLKLGYQMGLSRACMHTSEFSHPWQVRIPEAVAIQERLSLFIERQDRLGEVRRVAGLDVGFQHGGVLTRAAVVVYSFPELREIESAIACFQTYFPYVPGLLSFREIPAILEAMEQLSASPDLLLCDGQGIAHPRRCGLASHLGLLCDLPAIGAAKSRLIGIHQPVGDGRGDWQPLLDGEEVIGAVLRSRSGVRPLFVSIGHRLSLETAISYTLHMIGNHRLPEPLRRAHHLASG